MSRFVRQLYSAVLFTVLILIVEGCLISQRTHEEKSRVRASIAFDELKAEEGEKSTAYSNKDNQRKNSGLIEVEKNKSLHVKQGKRPGWINKESEHYPSSMYLTGVGYSSDRQSAEDKARSEIAKIFYSNIHSRTSTLQEYLQTTSESKEKVTERFDIEEITRVSTRKVLSGVRIAQVFKQTKPDNVFYALAVLDRKQSAMILKYKIQELDIEIKRLIHNAEKEEENKLSKIKILKEVIQQYILREAYDAEFRIVNKSGKGISSDTDFNEIKNCLTAILLRDFLIFLSVKGDRAAEIHEALIEGLNKQGFSISENFNKASVVVRGNVEIRPVEFGTQEWKYVRWRVYFDLIDQKGGAIFGSVSKTGRAGHISLPQAEDRAVLKVKKILTVDIADDINRYIFSQQVK